MSTPVNLNELTDSQLETAIQEGEGLTEDVVILEHLSECKVIESILVCDHEGNVTSLPTKVKYHVLIKDEMADGGSTDATIFVQVSRVGIVGQF